MFGWIYDSVVRFIGSKILNANDYWRWSARRSSTEAAKSHCGIDKHSTKISWNGQLGLHLNGRIALNLNTTLRVPLYNVSARIYQAGRFCRVICLIEMLCDSSFKKISITHNLLDTVDQHKNSRLPGPDDKKVIVYIFTRTFPQIVHQMPHITIQRLKFVSTFDRCENGQNRCENGRNVE